MEEEENESSEELVLIVKVEESPGERDAMGGGDDGDGCLDLVNALSFVDYVFVVIGEDKE